MSGFSRNAAALLCVSAICALAPSPGLSAEPQLRCGILSNPTPANWWLTDRDGEWTIGAQGGYQAKGLDALPAALFEEGWVRTNGYYGYRCACLKVTVDNKTRRVEQVFSGFGKPMRICRADRALQRALVSGNP